METAGSSFCAQLTTLHAQLQVGILSQAGSAGTPLQGFYAHICSLHIKWHAKTYEDSARLAKHAVGCTVVYLQHGCKDNTLILTRERRSVKACCNVFSGRIVEEVILIR